MSSQKRGRPELYTEAVCKTLLANAKEEGLSIKEYCRQSPHNHVYITVIVALKRHGLSPRAQVAKHTPYTAMDAMNRVDNDSEATVMARAKAGSVVLMDEEDTEQAISEAQGDADDLDAV